METIHLKEGELVLAMLINGELYKARVPYRTLLDETAMNGLIERGRMSIADADGMRRLPPGGSVRYDWER